MRFVRVSWRTVAVVPALGFLLSCGAGLRPARDAERLTEAPRTSLEVRPDDQDPLRLNLAYANRGTILGYGGLSLWARPKHDEIQVSAIVDAPVRASRWQSCRTATLGGVELAAEYIGRPMADGTYDAVHFDVGIHELRRLVRAGPIRGSVCGDPIELSDEHRRSIERFVRWFDRIAAPEQHGDAPAFREVGPKIPLLPVTDDDPGPYPA